MDISVAATDAERLEVRDFLAAHIPGIAADAVPALRNDVYYNPIIPIVRDGTTIAGAALTCTSQLSASASIRASKPGSLPPAAAPYLRLRDRHSELDLLAVCPTQRGRGIATALIEYMESRLRERGVRVWFGNVTDDLDVGGLTEFYRTRGFTVTELGAPLPPLLGVRWVLPAAEPAALYFYKQLK
jgi:GNAT superfamily N-acetyltransferase